MGTITRTAKDLVDGDTFSTDGGKTWHVFAVAGFGTVSCYLRPERKRTGARCMCYRVPVEQAAPVLVAA